MIASGEQENKRNKRLAWLFVLPALLGLLLFVLIPFLLAVMLSFTNLRLGSPLPLEIRTGLEVPRLLGQSRQGGKQRGALRRFDIVPVLNRVHDPAEQVGQTHLVPEGFGEHRDRDGEGAGDMG